MKINSFLRLQLWNQEFYFRGYPRHQLTKLHPNLPKSQYTLLINLQDSYRSAVSVNIRNQFLNLNQQFTFLNSNSRLFCLLKTNLLNFSIRTNALERTCPSLFFSSLTQVHSYIPWVKYLRLNYSNHQVQAVKSEVKKFSTFPTWSR